MHTALQRRAGLTPPHHLSPFAMCAAFPRSDYYEDSVTMSLAAFRPSRVPAVRTCQADLGAPFVSLPSLAGRASE